MKQVSLPVAMGILLALSSCTPFQQQKGTTPETVSDTQAQAAEKDNGEAQAKEDGPVPTDAQQESARAMMGNGDVTVLGGEYTEDTPAVPTGGVPGRRGIRMGNMAPPEEAASTADGTTPKPNRVEKNGLRSPSLPKGLPMDMNGKLNPDNTH